VPAMTFANLGNFKLQKWGFLLCNSVHFYFTTNTKYYKKGDDDKTIRNFKPKQNEVYC
jgi:hypothetical protein